MSNKFKDYFSEASDAYSTYRPKYPKQLFLYLSSISQHHEKAWDCATGSGQSAIALSEFFTEVVATDASKNQIHNATEKEGVSYYVEKAENTSIERDSVDLITVAQALHWFNIDEFTIEVRRVLKKNGLLAVWTYGLMDINPDINKVINHFYGTTLDYYWPVERKIVEKGYHNIKLPFHEIQTPNFEMESRWQLSQLIGYLCTWSAVKHFERKENINPVDSIIENISNSWGDPEQKIVIQWPLTLKVWVNNT